MWLFSKFGTRHFWNFIDDLLRTWDLASVNEAVDVDMTNSI